VNFKEEVAHLFTKRLSGDVPDAEAFNLSMLVEWQPSGKVSGHVEVDPVLPPVRLARQDAVLLVRPGMHECEVAFLDFQQAILAIAKEPATGQGEDQVRSW
jgi:hypothetical protein